MNPDELADFEEQRAFLRRSLEDLDRELAAGDLDELDAGTLRHDYARRLAAVERTIESGHVELASRPRRPRWRTITAIVLVATMALGAGAFVAGVAGSRKPGESATGNIRQSTNDQLAQASALGQRGNVLAALKLYQQVLDKDPRNIEALEESGYWLAAAAVQVTDRGTLLDQAKSFIARALAIAPNDPRGHLYLAGILQLQGDVPGAKAALTQALSEDPPATLRTQIEQFQASIGT